jgi:hypothetical protein
VSVDRPEQDGVPVSAAIGVIEPLDPQITKEEDWPARKRSIEETSPRSDLDDW